MRVLFSNGLIKKTVTVPRENYEEAKFFKAAGGK